MPKEGVTGITISNPALDWTAGQGVTEYQACLTGLPRASRGTLPVFIP